MRTGPRSRVAIALVVAATLAAGAGIAAWGVRSGWFDSGSVEGSTEGFVATGEEPGLGPTAAWPEYGYDVERTRSNPALAISPPFREAWRYDARSLLEFPPVLGGGRAVLATNDGRALALDARDGRVLWVVRLAGQTASSPALTGDLALFTTTRGRLVALDVATGRRRWAADLGGSSESSPLVVDGSAYVGTLAGLVLRVDVATGRVIWTARADGEVKASLARSGPNVVVGDYAGKVSAFSRRDGRVMWRRASPGRALRGLGRFYAGPAVAYGRIYVGNVNGRVLALQADTGAVAWVRVIDDLVYSSAAVHARTVYVGSYDHRLYALDAVTGRERWTFDAGERISGSPSVIGGLVYFSTLARGGRKGVTFALDAATGGRVWSFPDGRYSPAVATAGRLVLVGRRTLYGLEPG